MMRMARQHTGRICLAVEEEDDNLHQRLGVGGANVVASLAPVGAWPSRRAELDGRALPGAGPRKSWTMVLLLASDAISTRARIYQITKVSQRERG